MTEYGWSWPPDDAYTIFDPNLFVSVEHGSTQPVSYSYSYPSSYEYPSETSLPSISNFDFPDPILGYSPPFHPHPEPQPHFQSRLPGEFELQLQPQTQAAAQPLAPPMPVVPRTFHQTIAPAYSYASVGQNPVPSQAPELFSSVAPLAPLAHLAPAPVPASLSASPPFSALPSPAPAPAPAPVQASVPPPSALPFQSPAPAPASAPALWATQTPAAIVIPPPPPPISNKRKSEILEEFDLFPEDVDYIDPDDDRLNPTNADSCNQVRRKISVWIDSGAMTVSDFQNAIGVSAKGYDSFMNRSATWDGMDCHAYFKAHAFFKKRELQGLPIRAPKPRKLRRGEKTKTPSDLCDVSGVSLEGEDTASVPVYDTCDELRKKIRAFLTKTSLTQASFARELAKIFSGDRQKVCAADLHYFLGCKGVVNGNTNATYYAAYVFFEKMRVKAGKAKTQFREEMEEVYGDDGVDTKESSTDNIILRSGYKSIYDEYGRLHIVKREI